ncbi:hypothetical protein V8E54_003948 [Elaphomyces granulatus]
MGLPMHPVNPEHPRVAGIDLIEVHDIIKHAPDLHRHRGLPADTHGKIHEGLKACKEYIHDPEGVPDEVFETMNCFVMEYSETRIQFCDSNFNKFAVRVVNAAYQIAKIRDVLFSTDFRFTLKDLEDYGDYSPIIAQGLRCEFCFGHHYFNKVNDDTGVQFQWVEIARALKRRAKSLLPAHLWAGLSAVDEDVTTRQASVDEAIVKSFLEAAKAAGADQDAMVWQVVRYSDQERHPGPKELIRYEKWRSLTLHTQLARMMFDTVWRGPVHLNNRHREAARTMAIAVALVQCTWFQTIVFSPEGPLPLRSEYEDCQYPGPLQLERGESPHAMISPGVRLFNPALLHEEDEAKWCAVDKIWSPDASIDGLAAERWRGNMALFDLYPASYCLPPHERITQRRVEVLQTILSARANNGEDWWDRWGHDLGLTSLMALRYPMLYSDRFLLDIISIAADPDVNWQSLRRYNIARVPGRGLVSLTLTRFDGLFGPVTMFNPKLHLERIRTTLQRIQESRFEGLEFLLDNEPVDESRILWDNRGALIILDEMGALCRLDNMPNTEDEDPTWTDLCIGLRFATDSGYAAVYNLEFCKKLVELAGSSFADLYDQGWLRHSMFGIRPTNLLPPAQIEYG